MNRYFKVRVTNAEMSPRLMVFCVEMSEHVTVIVEEAARLDNLDEKIFIESYITGAIEQISEQSKLEDLVLHDWEEISESEREEILSKRPSV